MKFYQELLTTKVDYGHQRGTLTTYGIYDFTKKNLALFLEAFLRFCATFLPALTLLNLTVISSPNRIL